MIKLIDRMFQGRIMPPGDPAPFVFWRWMDVINPDGELYLRRLYIFRTPWCGLMLHQMFAPDWDRDGLHSHPWRLNNLAFLGVVLKGSYGEHFAKIPADNGLLRAVRWRERRWMRPFAFRCDEVHAIHEIVPGTATLCLTMPKRNDWGFYVPGRGIVKWDEFLDGAR